MSISFPLEPLPQVVAAKAACLTGRWPSEVVLFAPVADVFAQGKLEASSNRSADELLERALRSHPDRLKEDVPRSRLRVMSDMKAGRIAWSALQQVIDGVAEICSIEAVPAVLELERWARADAELWIEKET